MPKTHCFGLICCFDSTGCWATIDSKGSTGCWRLKPMIGWKGSTGCWPTKAMRPTIAMKATRGTMGTRGCLRKRPTIGCSGSTDCSPTKGLTDSKATKPTIATTPMPTIATTPMRMSLIDCWHCSPTKYYSHCSQTTCCCWTMMNYSDSTGWKQKPKSRTKNCRSGSNSRCTIARRAKTSISRWLRGCMYRPRPPSDFEHIHHISFCCLSNW